MSLNTKNALGHTFFNFFAVLKKILKNLKIVQTIRRKLFGNYLARVPGWLGPPQNGGI